MARKNMNKQIETDSTVAVALNRQNGIMFVMPDGRKVTINGNAAHLRGKEKGKLPSGAFGITVIAREDWDYIVKTYNGMEIFKTGLLFASDKKAKAIDEAEEKEETRHGLEPVNVNETVTRPADSAA